MNRILLLTLLLLTFSVCTVYSQAPVAKISATPIAGCAPLGVTFSDASTGGAATGWDWNFGGVAPAVSPATGNTRTAAVLYTKPGTYQVTLTVTNASGSSVATPVFITVFPAPEADFNVSKTTGCFPTNVDFTDQSTAGGSGASVVSWLWDFGDGVLDSIPDPSHIYTRGGSFLVTLYVKNSYGCRGSGNIKSVSGAIQLSNGVIPNFSAALENSCQVPIDATFTNQTTGPANLSYVWDFGDGSPTTTVISPTHSYTTAGDFKVKMIATSDKGCVDTLYNTVKVASSANVSSFDAPTAVCINTPVSFPNTSSPYPNASSWDYGDGSPIDAARDGAHTYTVAGTYPVTLTNTFANCSGPVTHNIQVVTQPTTAFTGTNVSGCKPPLVVNFTDQSVGGTSWLWNFGDGTTSTAQNPQHTYANYNSYNVTLTTSSGGGCSSTSPPKTAFVNITKPIVSIPTLPGYGCAPFTFNPSISVTAVDGIASYLWDFGNGNTSTSASPPAQIYGPGTYTVSLTITTNGGCTASATGIVKVGTIQPVPDFTASTTSVCIKTDVQFTDHSTGGADQWLWNFGDGSTSGLQNPVHSFQKPGTYIVKLIAYNNGCHLPVPKTLTIVVNPPLADFSYTFNCASKSTIIFQDKSIGATTWDWDFGDMSPHYTGGPTPPAHAYAAPVPTDFTVTLTVTNGSCTDVISQKITVNQSSSLTVSANPVCNSTNVVFTAHVPSYVLSYVYDFGDGNQTAPMTGSVSHVYPKPGNYNVVLTTTANNGCVDPVAPLVMHISGPTVKFTSSSQQLCGTGASSTFAVQFTDQSTASAGSAIAKWEWDFGDGQKSTTASPSHTYTNEGIYTVKLKLTDVLGCTDSLVMPSYIIFSKPVAKFTTVDVNFCPTSQIKFTNASSSVFNPVYTWDFGDGSPIFTGQNPPSHTYAADGNYTVKLSMTDSYGCPSTFDNAAAQIHIDHPVAGFTLNQTFKSCPPLVALFTFTGSYAKTYIWSFGDGSISNLPNPSHSYTLPGDYQPTLTIISPGGCSNPFTGPNIHIEGPVGQLEYSPLGACNDINVNFKVTTAGVVQFTWLFGDDSPPEITTTATTTHEYKIPGVYVPLVILKDGSDCDVPYSGTKKITVDGITKTAFTADKTLLCDNGTIHFKDASLLATGTVINTYVWNFGDLTAPVAGMNPTISHLYPAVGNYPVKMTITTVNGCADEFTMPVEIAASPQISIGGMIPQCEPATLHFTGIETVPDPNGPLSWKWDFDNGGQTSDVQNPPDVLYPKAGSYDVSVVATNKKGCSTTYPAPVVPPATPQPLLIYKIPAVDAGKDMTVCLGGPDFKLNATGDIGNSYTWETPVNGTLSCLACADPMANSPASTNFVVTGLSPFSCKANDTIHITVNMPVTVTVSGPDSVCLGQSAQLVASGAAIYEWTPADGLSDPAIANPVSTPTASMMGTDLRKIFPYLVTGWDNIKCFHDIKTVNITAFNYPSIDVGPDVTIPVGSSYQINGTGSSDIVSLSWTPTNALGCSNCLSPLANPIKTTDYVLRAENDGTCVSSDSIKITVICNNGNFFIPNTFSPNGDGSNDRFIVRGKGLNIIPSITVFNRWGQVVFEKRNFAANDEASGWDGTFNGKPAPSDVYIYTIQILCDNATLIPYHGNVTLVR